MGCALAAFATTHLVMERMARWAEVDLGAYTWWQEEYLQLLTPTNYVGRGPGRLLMYGPSESREAFIPERLDGRLPGLHAYQHAQSAGTMEDGLVVLDYIDKAYGPSAVPEALLWGISTRFMADIHIGPSPLRKAINRYSADFRVERGVGRSSLVRKSTLESWTSRFAFLRRQQQRYRSTIRAFARAGLLRAWPNNPYDTYLRRPLTPAKYHHLPPYPIEATKAFLSASGGWWDEVHHWNPAADRDRIARELGWLLDYTHRHGIDLYVVNMPELSWNRRLYKPGAYQDYLDAVRSAIGDTPFLNLRLFLPDEEFYDSCHPTLAGSIKVTDRITTFIAAHRKAQPEAHP